MFKSDSERDRSVDVRERRAYEPPKVERAAPVGVVTMGFSVGVVTP